MSTLRFAFSSPSRSIITLGLAMIMFSLSGLVARTIFADWGDDNILQQYSPTSLVWIVVTGVFCLFLSWLLMYLERRRKSRKS